MLHSTLKTLALIYQIQKMKKRGFIKGVLVLALFITGIGANAQKQKDEALYKEIEKMDSLVFGAFNSRDTATFNKHFVKDLEFYHDKGGLTGYAQTVSFAKAQAESKSDLVRTLVPGSLEVYPIKNYGAIQVGAHKFCHTENGKQDCGTFKFVHIWQKINNEWKITRVVSYDH